MRMLEAIILAFLACPAASWAPPGMSERDGADHQHGEDRTDLPPGHKKHHDHSDNLDVADLVVDEEHLVDDMEGIYTKKELEEMEDDEKIFSWFTAHDWDLDEHLDGLELVKALSHEHNYHHPEEENIPEGDIVHDPHQHTEAADKQRFRRTVNIVDAMLEEDDSDKDGRVSFAEFMSAFYHGRLDGLKLRKVKTAE